MGRQRAVPHGGRTAIRTLRRRRGFRAGGHMGALATLAARDVVRLVTAGLSARFQLHLCGAVRHRAWRLGHRGAGRAALLHGRGAVPGRHVVVAVRRRYVTTRSRVPLVRHRLRRDRRDRRHRPRVDLSRRMAFRAATGEGARPPRRRVCPRRDDGGGRTERAVLPAPRRAGGGDHDGAGVGGVPSR